MNYLNSLSLHRRDYTFLSTSTTSKNKYFYALTSYALNTLYRKFKFSLVKTVFTSSRDYFFYRNCLFPLMETIIRSVGNHFFIKQPE